MKAKGQRGDGNRQGQEAADPSGVFDPHRPLLFSIAYRMLGSVMDAEDVVQEAYLRWQRAPEAEIRSPRAYLSAIVTRLRIDQLRRVKARREEYVGSWLPEPLPTEPAPDGPGARVRNSVPKGRTAASAGRSSCTKRAPGRPAVRQEECGLHEDDLAASRPVASRVGAAGGRDVGLTRPALILRRLPVAREELGLHSGSLQRAPRAGRGR
jgi:DNA-directed RNA polymerase specialized sigma24 family protein